jgi:hypothetical protein
LIVNQGDSVELKARVKKSHEWTMQRLELMYQPELATLSAPERRQMLIALEAITDVESWARMREFFGLSFDEVRLAWAQVIDRLLPGGSAHAASEAPSAGEEAAFLKHPCRSPTE